ncbi:hypothetical protein BH23CHL2_BH23CHL2_10800 [soil metagenome]
MQRDEIHLRNILALGAELDALLTGVDASTFIATDCIRSAVLLKLIFIGEATRYISDELRNRYPEIRWSRIVGFRNVTVHQYWEVDWAIVWSTANFDAQEYRDQVAAILESEFPSNLSG